MLNRSKKARKNQAETEIKQREAFGMQRDSTLSFDNAVIRFEDKVLEARERTERQMGENNVVKSELITAAKGRIMISLNKAIGYLWKKQI